MIHSAAAYCPATMLSRAILVPFLAFSSLWLAHGFAPALPTKGQGFARGSSLAASQNNDKDLSSRRGLLNQAGKFLAAAGIAAAVTVPQTSRAADRRQELPGGKPPMKYSDFVETPSGLQYKEVKEGKGESPVEGDRVVFNWEGYTIGYYGRIFEAKGRVKGGAFEGDTDYTRFVLGKQRMIPGVEEALKGMKPGSIRQLIIPPELGYPLDDPKHEKVGPKPSTFSGQRALDFVLQNPQNLIDKTLLINVELVRVDKPGQRGFKG